MSKMFAEMFEWAEYFDDLVEEARKAGKKSVSVKAPKLTKTMQQKVVEMAGHKIVNTKATTWKVNIDVEKAKFPKITVVSLK